MQCKDSNGEKKTIATFHERPILLGKRKAFIELHSGYEDILDILVGMSPELLPTQPFAQTSLVAFVVAYRIRELQVAGASSYSPTFSSAADGEDSS